MYFLCVKFVGNYHNLTGSDPSKSVQLSRKLDKSPVERSGKASYTDGIHARRTTYAFFALTIRK